VTSIADTLPTFASEIAGALGQERRDALAAQLVQAQITEITYDESADAGYIYLAPPVAALRAVHNEAAKVRETIPFAAPHWFNIDVDHEGYAFGVELLGRREIIFSLREGTVV
jgi:uncharacterized protein YuzE